MTVVSCICEPPRPSDPEDPYALTDETRELGLGVCRGTCVMVLSPLDGTESVANPFNAEAEPVI